MDSEFEVMEENIADKMRSIYSDTVIDYAMNPRNVGSIPNADGFACVTGPCGDTMEIWLRVKEDRIRYATFWTDGCGTSIACGSMTTELVKGKSIGEALGITQKDILSSLGGLPEESQHCALLASNTLKAVLRDYLALKNEPWKRAYRNNV
ncbi:MAG TPA: iron-sulfur cluster assembly scaffold protein [Dehalococcoidia bacterium]|nr:iron-sulfur cluster assembly scaffold protein [Dehalococcoidia bacterium]